MKPQRLINASSYAEDCPHCNPQSFALKHLLLDSSHFRVVCDVHPLTEGHILIIPKEHIPCIGACFEATFRELEKLYDKVVDFQKVTYGKHVIFEHGVVGQTVLHAHVHFLPFPGELQDIVPEKDNTRPLSSLGELQNIYRRDGKYLFLSVNDKLFTVDSEIGKPGFFRNRIAEALGVPARGDWKRAREDEKINNDFATDIAKLKEKWAKYISVFKS